MKNLEEITHSKQFPLKIFPKETIRDVDKYLYVNVFMPMSYCEKLKTGQMPNKRKLFK